MNQNEVDKIIAEAVAESKKGSQKRWHKGKTSSDGITKTRAILNWVFMLGFIVAIMIYFVLPDQKIWFFSIGFGAIILKLVEFYLRFMF